MLQLTIALTSGRSESLRIPESSKVGDLKLLAKRSFGQPFLRLATAEGRVLTDLELVQTALQDGDQLTAIVGQGKLLATATGFALWCPGGDRVVHWGETGSGVSYLKSVQELYATNFAFAAILGNNSVVTWGDIGYGGNSSGMQDQLKNLRQIKGSAGAFAAILQDGSLVTWGGQLLVQTSLKWDINWRMWEKCRPRRVHLLRSWKMAVLLHGAIPILVVTALQSKINWRVCNRFMPQLVHLPRSLKMALLWHGAIRTLVVTALQCKSSLGMCSSFKPRGLHLLPF